MKSLCVGNTWDLALIAGIKELNALNPDVKVKELFGSIPLIAPSVRTPDRLPTKSVVEVEAFIRIAKQEGIEIHWTLNQMLSEKLEDFDEKWKLHLLPAIHELRSMGVDHFAIANPLLLSLVRKEFPTAYLEASTIAGVNTVKMLDEWRRLGASGVCPVLDLNRDLDGLRSMVRAAKKYGLRVKVLVNEACLQGCPHRHTTCYLSQSMGSVRSESLFQGYPFWCNDRREEDPSEWLKAPVILPEWLDYYEEITGVEWFKVTGRTHTTEAVLSIVESYITKHSPDNFMELIPGYVHLRTGEMGDLASNQGEVVVDSKTWNTWPHPWIQNPKFRCLDNCGVNCTSCDQAFLKVGKVGGAAHGK